MTTPSQPEQPQPAQDPADTGAVALRLAQALEGMSANLDEVKAASEARDAQLKRYGRHNRWFIVFDVVMTVGFAVSTAVAIHAVNSANAADSRSASAAAAASANHSAAVAGCQQGNQIRAQQSGLNQQGINLWLSLRNPGMPETPEQAKAIAAFRAKIAKADVQRDCAAAYPAPKAVPPNGK